MEESATDTDFVWIHDYHLLVLPSLLRKRFNRIRCGVFLHCPFPSSEIFRTFPKREEVLRSLLNAGAHADAGTSTACLPAPPATSTQSALPAHAASARVFLVCLVSRAVCHTDKLRGHRETLHSAPVSDSATALLLQTSSASTRLTTRGTSCHAARACWAWSTRRHAAASPSSTTAATWASRSCPQVR